MKRVTKAVELDAVLQTELDILLRRLNTTVAVGPYKVVWTEDQIESMRQTRLLTNPGGWIRVKLQNGMRYYYRTFCSSVGWRKS